MDRPLARRLATSLASVTRRRLRGRRLTFLPDLFIDHFVRFKSWASAVPRLREIHDRGGGGYPGGEQRIAVGGNAANVALALARLGADVHLIAHTDEVGLAVLRHQAGPAGLGTARVQKRTRPSITAALEFADTNANVLVSQAGPVAGFGPESLEAADWDLIEGSDIVGVVNWALNKRGGTALAQEVFRRAKRAGATTFFDSADPSHRPGDLGTLRRRVLSSSDLDIWGLNENELRAFAASFPGRNGGARTDPLDRLRRITRARLDLHGRDAAVSDVAGVRTRVAAVPVRKVERVTGAGDAWNAGNLLGDILGLPTDERLLLAHSVAAFYISNVDPVTPTFDELRRSVARLARGSKVPSLAH